MTDEGNGYQNGNFISSGLVMIPHGQGTKTKPDGSYYSGEFINGAAEGLGTAIFENGDSYQGDFQADTYYGFGQFYHAKLKMKYIGYFREGLKHGKGREEFEDGSLFVGYFVKGERHGFGEFKGVENSSYKGMW